MLLIVVIQYDYVQSYDYVSHSLELYYLVESYNMTLPLHMTMSCHNTQQYPSVRSIVSLEAIIQSNPVMLKCHLDFLFYFFTITTANVDAGIGGSPTVVISPNEVGRERTFAVGHRIQCQNVGLGQGQQGQGQRSGSRHHCEPNRRPRGGHYIVKLRTMCEQKKIYFF
jgi:hypothetical protein